MAIGSVPLCVDHHREVVAAVQGSVAAETPLVPDVVYYIGDPDSQLVKIGTSSNLRVRLSDLRVRRPRALLLACEPGSHRVETKRHRQFATLAEPLPSGEREWFRKAPILMEHVGQMRHAYGLLSSGQPVWKAWVAPLRG